MKVKIGTRGSKLALWQAYHVEALLGKAGISSKIIIIETKGDKILDRSLSKIGSKGVFTQELEDQLLSGEIDIAVHSAKDLQSTLDDNFEILAFTEREKVNDVLVSHDTTLTLKSGKPFVIGTSSTRRIAILKHFYPHIKTVDMRGNLQTRLRKLEEGQCDALLLAYAGVHRMKYDEKIVELLSLNEFIPAVGQGTIAIECAFNMDPEKKKKIKDVLNHPETEACLLAERAFLKKLEGGCSIPSFGLGTLQNSMVNLSVGLVSLDGKDMIRKNGTAEVSSASLLGTQLAEELLEAGGDRILAEIKSQQASK
jgi:hydroxymethylbilane synthase